LKEIFIQYKPFFTFLIKFVLFYFVFAFIYDQYLNQFDVSIFELDSITKLVSDHTVYIMRSFNEDYYVVAHDNEAAMKVIYNG